MTSLIPLVRLLITMRKLRKAVNTRCCHSLMWRASSQILQHQPPEELRLIRGLALAAAKNIPPPHLPPYAPPLLLRLGIVT